MEMNLDGQQVAVFGSARGIGAAIASQFADEGSLVHGYDCQPPNPTQETSSVSSLVCDVTNLQDVQRAAAEIPDPRHVVFSVGMGSGKTGFPFWNVPSSDWARVMDVNLMGAVNVAHVFAPLLAEKKCGSMLFLVSVAGQIGSQTDPPYSAAKAALINFMQCAARDLAPFGVRVNALAPGMVQTELNRSVWQASQSDLPIEEKQTYEEWGREKIGRVAPLGRWQTPNECAAMAVYLASEHARNITGQTINVDGGQVMHS